MLPFLMELALDTFVNAKNVTNPFRGLVQPNPGYNGATIRREQLLTPFLQFTDLIVSEYNGTSDYRSIQLQLNKRLSQRVFQ